ncbi:MAG: Z1 domain-containing protein, partial [Lachnospiraceae bacterium]
MILGEYYKTKCAETGYSEKLKKCIEDACKYCISNIQSEATNSPYYKGEHPLMFLGKIQSGKTRAFTGLMALAFDNNFDNVFILTKNSKALVEQTYKRMRKEFKAFLDRDEVDVSDIMKLQDELTPYELEKKLIIIAKKQKDNLERIGNFIKDSMINDNKNCLIIDDEADTTGVGYEKIKDTTEEFDLRTVAAEVDRIRGSLDGCVFVQVTATPYALYLQPDFDGSEIKPVKPKKTVLVPSGESYIGGEYYFLESNKEDSPGRFIFEEVSDEEQEIASAKTTDRRRFKEEQILIREDRMSTFKRGVVNFIMGGCILNTNGIKQKYAYVIHTAVAQQAHDRVANITKILIQQIKQKNPEHMEYIERLLAQSYEDMSKSVIEFGFKMPTFEDVKKEFHLALQQGVKISVINAKDDINKYLNEDTGELRLRTPFSIFVGGQVLDRGITIPNMVGFYYGRNPKTMQQDTVMQHSRMFGYRGSELLAVTRFYTTRKIYESMVKITEIDVALRDDIENERFEDG